MSQEVILCEAGLGPFGNNMLMNIDYPSTYARQPSCTKSISVTHVFVAGDAPSQLKGALVSGANEKI